MRLLALIFFTLLSACGTSSSGARTEDRPCELRQFERSEFILCRTGKREIQLVAAGPKERPIRRFVDLERALGDRAEKVAFAMNAGMYDEEGRPIGLAIVEGKQIHAINRNEGGGNFHLMPNGVFQVSRDGKAAVMTSDDWQPSPGIRLATQSGPMLVIDGKLHPAFEPDGESRYIRNGVGIAPDGSPVFVISEDAVSLGKFARFFRDEVKAKNALFLDGAVSALWAPERNRKDVTRPLGPMIVVFKPEE